MFIKLKENVYLVNGSRKCAIYDLNNEKLYHLDKEMAILIRKSFREPLDSKEFEEIKPLIEDFGLLEYCKNPWDEIPISCLRKDRRPSFAWLEITQQCNLACTFCYEKSSACEVKIMSMENFEIAKNFLIKSGVKKIQFIGGEPMLHPKLREMIIKSREFFEFIEVYTNGTLITPEWCDFFKKYNVNIALSIHSYISTEHDKVTRVSGSHKKVSIGADLLLKNGIKCRFAAIRNKDIEIGTKPEECSYTIKKSEPRLTGRCTIDQYDFDMFQKRAITYNTFKGKLKKDFVNTCVCGHQCFGKNLYIAYDLEVFPCVMERRFSHGSIKDENFKLKQLYKDYCKDNIDGCKDCEFRYTCFDCRPDSGGMPVKAKPWYCTYDQEKGEFADLRESFKKVQVQLRGFFKN